MKEQTTFRKTIEKVWKNRAAIVIAIAATVFMCGLTVLEFMALRMEWNLPVLSYLTGDSDSYIFEEYRSDEMKLDDSTENVLLEETDSLGQEFSGDSSLKNGLQERDSRKDSSPGELLQENDLQEDSSNSNDSQEKSDLEHSAENTETSAEAEYPYYLKVNRKENCITVYTLDENGEYTVPYKAMICSTGLYNGTPRGVFHLSTKYLWRELYGKVYGQYATRITGGVLFHSVPYYKKSKNALCTDKYNTLGQQASMGCVRLTVEDAKWIADNCPAGTTVEIYDDDDPGPLGKPEAAHIDTDSPNKGWDPTDPDEDNPWHQLSDDQ